MLVPRSPPPPILRSLRFLLLLWLSCLHVCTRSAPPEPVTALAFAPDASALVSNGRRSVVVRDPTLAQPVAHWPCPLPKITSLRFHPTGRQLAITGGIPAERGELRLLAWPDGAFLAVVPVTGDVATAADFSPDGDRILLADATGLARVWKLSTDAPGAQAEFTLAGHSGPVLAVGWSPSGNLLVTAGTDRSLKVWSATDGRLVRTFTHHTEPPHALAFRPRQRSDPDTTLPLCISGGDDRTVRVWQPGIGRMLRIVRHHRGSILALAWASGGQSFYTAGSEGILRRVDASSDTILAEHPASPDWILSITAHPDGSGVAVGDASGVIRIVRLP